MSIKYIFPLLFSIFILKSCANIQPPGGGPKDEEAPKFKTTSPKQGQTNYKEQKILFVFDENIQPNNLTEQLIITPLVDVTNYETLIRKDQLHIIFKEPLEENTTYTINLREGIKDLNEGTPTDNPSLTFSTGDYLDSIKLAGTVQDLLTKKYMENINITLYKAGDTTHIANAKPMYLGKTDKSGAFTIKNIKPGKYDLYALQDNNKNLLFNEGEKIAFEKNLSLDSNRIDILMQLVKTDTTPPRIIKNLAREGNYEIQFNEGITNVKIFSNTDTLIYKTSADGKTISLFNTTFNYDSLITYIHAVDSMNNVLKDTLSIIFKKQEEKQPFTITVKPETRKLNPNDIKITIETNKPIISFFKEKIKLNNDTSNTKIQNLNITKASATEITITTEEKLKEPIKLIIEDSSIVSIDTLLNMGDTIQFAFMKEEEYGIIKGRINSSYDSYIIELLNDKYELVKSERNSNTINYTFLNPGTYYLRAKIDENNNKRWDSGNPFKNLHPEPVIFYKDPIQIRANWEILDLNFSF